jgi:hypothetical protein
MNNTLPEASSGATERAGPDEGALVAVLSAAAELRERLETALVGVGLSVSKFDALEQLIQAGESLTLGSPGWPPPVRALERHAAGRPARSGRAS